MDEPITKKEYVEIVDFLEKHERYLDSEILNVVKYLTDDIIELGYNIAYNTQKIGITNIKELYDSVINDIENNYSMPEIKKHLINVCNPYSTNDTESEIEKESIFYKLFVITDAVIHSEHTPINLKEYVGYKFMEYGDGNSRIFEKFGKKLLHLNNDEPSEKLLNLIVDKYSELIMNRILYEKKSYHKQSNGFSDELNNKMIRRLSDNDSIRPKEKFHILSHLTDESLVDYVLERLNFDENAIVYILENEKISDDKKNEIFDEYGCNILQINTKNVPQHIIDSIIEQVWMTLFDIELRNIYINNYSALTKEEKDAVRDAQRVLLDIITNHKLPESRQIDLANRFLSENSRSMQWVERDLVIHASSPDALRILSKLKNKDKEMAFENPNCPEDVLQKRATEQYKKIKAKIKKDTWVSDKFSQDLFVVAKKISLPDEYYDTILESRNSRVVGELIPLDTTPTSVLQKYQKNKSIASEISGVEINVPDNIRIYSALTLFARSHDLQPKMLIDTFEFIDCLDREYNDYTNQDSYMVRRAKNEMERIISKYSREDINELDNIVKNIKNVLHNLDIEKNIDIKFENYNNLKNVYKPTERCTDESKEITTSTIKRNVCDTSTVRRIKYMSDNYEKIKDLIDKTTEKEQEAEKQENENLK